MFQSQMQSGVVLLVVVLFLCATSLVHAAENSYMARTEDVSAEEINVDGLLLRPSGIVATVMGTEVLVVTLPVSIPTRSVV